MSRIALVCSALVTFTGCLAVHADLPENLMDDVTVQVRDVQLGSICSYDGRVYSPGASLCMERRSMRCDPGGAWVDAGSC